jgi:nucleoside-diphosphate-sugar epimerase
MDDSSRRIVITGGAGLVGQNLVLLLCEQGCRNLCVLDRSEANLRILRQLNPGIEALEADLAVPGDWERHVGSAEVLVQLHAQIGGVQEEAFRRNNLVATRNVLAALGSNPGCFVVHVSSSAVTSQADDWYVRTKREQEQLVLAASNPCCVLRPTLMFGWFDRKHFGWLSRFMRRVPVFPVPGSGNYLRQPLYAADFCRIILRCIERRDSGMTYDISGKEKVPYIQLVESIRAAVGSNTRVLRIPVTLFRQLLRLYALFDRDPPFTARQLDALVIDEVFEDFDWEKQFGLRATPLAEALERTFRDPRYRAVELEF